MGALDAEQVDHILSFAAMRDEHALQETQDAIDLTYDIFLEKLTHSELKEFLHAAVKNQQYKNSGTETKSYILFKPVSFIISRHHSEKDSAKTLMALLSNHEDTTRFFRDFFVYTHRQTLLEALFIKGRAEVLQVVKERLSKETEGARPGAYDKRLEVIIDGLLKKKRADLMLAFRYRIFTAIQKERRGDSKRLPLPPSSVDEVVFVIEEAARESYAYEIPDFQKASKYLRVVLDWYFDRPKMVHEAEFEHALEIDLLIDDELGELSRTLPTFSKDAETARRLWKVANRLLANRRLIEKMKVLNGEMDRAGSVLERDKEMIKRARTTSGVTAVAMPVILLTGGRAVPLLARGIGLTARGIINTGSATAALTTRAAQHIVVAITTSATVTEAVAYLGTTAWVFYLSRAPQINQGVLTGAEMVLDFMGSEAGIYSLSPDDAVHVAYQATSDTYQALKLKINLSGNEVTAVVQDIKQISREVFEGDFAKGKKLFVEKAGETTQAAVTKTKTPDPVPSQPPEAIPVQTPSSEADEWRKTAGGRPDDAERAIDGPVIAPNDQITQIKSREERLYRPPAQEPKGKGAPKEASLGDDNRALEVGGSTRKVASSVIWTQRGKLKVNKGSYKLKKQWIKGQDTGTAYEQGFNLIVPRMARDVSKKPVRVDLSKTSGYKTPSSAVTNRLKYQKTRRGDMLYRTPDATMEVIEKTPGGATSVAEVHFWEATTQTAFKPRVKEAGRKRRQIEGTVWISTEIERKGYTPDTRLYYHIVAPEEPTEETIDYLNGIMDDIPNLEIDWFVVP